LKLRILTEADCRALLGMREAIDIQAEAFALLAAGQAVEGLRSVASSREPPGVAIFNPCFLKGGRGYGIKVVSDFFGNSEKGLPRMMGLITLFDGQSGAPRTLMEGGYVTDLRTGAATGLAARHLARRDSKVLAVIGAGRVARNQIEGLCAVFPFEKIHVFARTPDKVEALMKTFKDIVPAQSAEAAVREADIVVAATTSPTPVVRGEWLKPGAFVAAVGAYAVESRELDDEVIRRAACHVIDSRADVLDRAGDFVIPLRVGLLRREEIAEISEILSGARAGRRSPQDIIVFKSSGVPIQDLITAQHIERRAAQKGAGREIEMGGDHD
jgi:ornithine cyclodeaminase/alanine dehydrogenase-like protein (mu-crystallin family)